MDLYDTYVLGGDIEYFRNIKDLKEEIVKERKKTRSIPLLDILRRIWRDLIEYEINSAVQQIVFEWITKLERDYKAGQKLKEGDAKELSQEADRLDDLLGRELLNRPIIELTRKGCLNQKALLSTSRREPSPIFENKIWKKLPSIAQSDFSDAAKCLLVEASTPATMVALRGMEAVMREYYEFKKARKCGKKALGSIIKELRSLPDANAKLLGYIDYLRSEKRNFAQHPDRTFTQREAERIFMEIINAVHDIFVEML